jgi:acetyl-CoA synthetase
MKEMNLKEMGVRIREMREITGFSIEKMSDLVGVNSETYMNLESGTFDPPFTVLHRCAVALGVDVTSLLEGHTAKLSGYMVTRKGQGLVTTDENGIKLQNMAAMFKNRLATPYYVTYQYDENLQDKPIQTTTHAGQEFDLVLEGAMKIRIGDHIEELHEGDSVFYQSSNPHGMLAIGGKSCKFLAMIMAEDEQSQRLGLEIEPIKKDSVELIAQKYIKTVEDERGRLQHIDYVNIENFNFAFDIVDGIAEKYPEKIAMVHVSDNFTERKFTFKDISLKSNKMANYFLSLGISKGDKVMLVMKRHHQFWPAILALHKIGAVAIPATSQLMVHDFEYRFKAADVKAAICTNDDNVPEHAAEAIEKLGVDIIKILVNGQKPQWHNLDEEIQEFSDVYERPLNAPGGNDPMLMFFTSGTTGYPKMALHSYKYPFGHYVTAKYWHQVERDGLHFTISETGWAKAMWGKLYGQWLCEAAIFVYDFSRFHPERVLPMFEKYGITTFCAPPTMYRMLIKEDISKYDFSSVRHATTAGEALNPEVFVQFERATGLKIYEGFGQTETTCALGNLFGDRLKLGSMGKPIPDYGIDLVDEDGNSVKAGEHGEIVIRTTRSNPRPGVFIGYYKDEEKTSEAWRGGMYHTCDLAWKDEDDYYHYVGRADDVIKSSGYRIGPFEIENVIMELPYVVECGVSAAADPVRGQVVKATIKLVKGKEGTEELKKEIQDYVKTHTAPYKYPRIVVFADELPKTVSGKIQRSKL